MRDLIAAARRERRTVLVISHAPVEQGLVDREVAITGGRLEGRVTT